MREGVRCVVGRVKGALERVPAGENNTRGRGMRSQYQTKDKKCTKLWKGRGLINSLTFSVDYFQHSKIHIRL